MRKYIIPSTIAILLFTSFFINYTIKDSRFTTKKGLSYSTRQEAIEIPFYFETAPYFRNLYNLH